MLLLAAADPATAPASSCAQTGEGESEHESRAPAAREIQAFIQRCWDKFRAAIKAGKLKLGFCPHWSLDNANVHKSACGEPTWEGGRPPGPMMEIWVPPWSPDLHKPIEHVHGTVVSATRAVILQEQKPRACIEEYFKEVQKQFYARITAQGVSQDVASLQDTYREVLRLKGRFPPPKFR